MTTATDRNLRVHVRWMIRPDMPDVLRIEGESFSFPRPWSEDEFLRTLRERNCIGMVAESNDRVVGYMIYELCKNKLHILNFAVDPARRRAGVGGQMVAKLQGKLSAHRRTTVAVTACESNLAAHLFFRSQGFLAVKVLRGYYDVPACLDGYRMVYRLPS